MNFGQHKIVTNEPKFISPTKEIFHYSLARNGNNKGKNSTEHHSTLVSFCCKCTRINYSNFMCHNRGGLSNKQIHSCY